MDFTIPVPDLWEPRLPPPPPPITGYLEPAQLRTGCGDFPARSVPGPGRGGAGEPQSSCGGRGQG